MHLCRLQVLNLASKIGLIKYGNIVKLSLITLAYAANNRNTRLTVYEGQC